MKYFTVSNVLTLLFLATWTFFTIIGRVRIELYFVSVIQTTLLVHLVFNGMFDKDKSKVWYMRILDRVLGKFTTTE